MRVSTEQAVKRFISEIEDNFDYHIVKSNPNSTPLLEIERYEKNKAKLVKNLGSFLEKEEERLSKSPLRKLYK